MASGMRLKKLLAMKGVKQTAVAEAIGMKKTAFNAIVNGHATLRVDTLEKVCAFLGVPPAYFFKFKVQEDGTINATQGA